eukprot:1799810-Pleurochrysis_carterae.AAC.10
MRRCPTAAAACRSMHARDTRALVRWQPIEEEERSNRVICGCGVRSKAPGEQACSRSKMRVGENDASNQYEVFARPLTAFPAVLTHPPNPLAQSRPLQRRPPVLPHTPPPHPLHKCPCAENLAESLPSARAATRALRSPRRT